MTLEGMNSYLIEKGFKVHRERDKVKQVYVFTIHKDGISSCAEFKYPDGANWEHRDKCMREFLGNMVREYYEFTDKVRSKNSSTHVSDDLILRRMGEVFDTLTREQQTAVYEIVGRAIHENCTPKVPAIQNVIFNPPATIVFWADGTKTVVKAQNEDEFDAEKGLAMAISKKALGNQGNYFNTFTKWTASWKKEEDKIDEKVNAIIKDIRKSDDNVFDQAVRYCVEKIKKDILGVE